MYFLHLLIRLVGSSLSICSRSADKSFYPPATQLVCRFFSQISINSDLVHQFFLTLSPACLFLPFLYIFSLVALFLNHQLQTFWLLLGLFHHPFFSHAQTIAISAFLRTPLFSPVISLIVSLLMSFLDVFPQIICIILISIVCNFLQGAALVTATHGTSHATFVQAFSQFQQHKSFRQYA